MTNIFEDSSHLKSDEGWLRRVEQMQRMPEDYGVAWYEPHLAVAVCAPLPWHSVFGWAYRAYWTWRKGGKADRLTLAYQRGVEDAQRSHDIQRTFGKEQERMARLDGERRAAAEARAEVYNELLRLAATGDWRTH